MTELTLLHGKEFYWRMRWMYSVWLLNIVISACKSFTNGYLASGISHFYLPWLLYLLTVSYLVYVKTTNYIQDDEKIRVNILCSLNSVIIHSKHLNNYYVYHANVIGTCNFNNRYIYRKYKYG